MSNNVDAIKPSSAAGKAILSASVDRLLQKQNNTNPLLDESLHSLTDPFLVDEEDGSVTEEHYEKSMHDSELSLTPQEVLSGSQKNNKNHNNSQVRSKKKEEACFSTRVPYEDTMQVQLVRIIGSRTN